jgi:hypothetical protein
MVVAVGGRWATGGLVQGGAVGMRELKALEIAARSYIAFAKSVWVVPS